MKRQPTLIKWNRETLRAIEDEKRSRRPRHVPFTAPHRVKPLFDGPIPDNPEYRELVESILKAKVRRELIESYQPSRRSPR